MSDTSNLWGPPSYTWEICTSSWKVEEQKHELYIYSYKKAIPQILISKDQNGQQRIGVVEFCGRTGKPSSLRPSTFHQKVSEMQTLSLAIDSNVEIGSNKVTTATKMFVISTLYSSGQDEAHLWAWIFWFEGCSREEEFNCKSQNENSQTFNQFETNSTSNTFTN